MRTKSVQNPALCFSEVRTIRRSIHDLQSDAVALKVLRSRHKNAPPAALYKAADKVAASARQAANFDRGAIGADLSVLPLLRYYALLHWLKALLYLCDLHYPPTTSVLQHGLSSRRAKRDAYHWPLESIYVYKEGVLQSFAAITMPGVPLPARVIVGDLLGCLPAMHRAMSDFYPQFLHVYPVAPMGRSSATGPTVSGVQAPNGRSSAVAPMGQASAGSTGPAAVDVDGSGSKFCLISRKIASNQSLTVDQWKKRYVAQEPEHLLMDGSGKPEDSEPEGMMYIRRPTPDHPWLIHTQAGDFLSDNTPYPEWLIDFVVLYTLSSLCRYNAEEWSDILLWNNEEDAYLVREYLPPSAVAAGLPSSTAAQCLVGEYQRLLD